ncbi:MAG TPA: acyl-CoA dehydrogenase family protein [Chthoniobacterales bacterium]|nr:acyl-CoA dehydrogenase family protein [Chthoniobacterales bacterium]
MDQFFNTLTDFLETEVVPIANRLDEEEALFREVYGRFIKLKSLNLLIPQNLGGFGGGRKEWIEYNILMAQYSGALLFLQAQHQFSISRLKQLLPYPKVEETLRSLAKAEQGVGLALSKNRNLLEVKKTEEGYRLSGKFLWATGYTYFSHLLVSFHYEDELLYTLLPFQAMEVEGASIVVSPKIETVVFNAIDSNSVILDHWLIPQESILARHEVLPKTPVEHPSIYNFAGASNALLRLAIQGTYGKTAEVQGRHALLSQQWEQYYRHIMEGEKDPFALRVEGLELSEQCVLLARVACGSAGILKAHPLGRFIREIWQYTVAGYSEDQVKAYLKSWAGKDSNL